MKTVILLAASFAAAARADFSYTATLKSAAPQVTKYSIKGQKMLIEVGPNAYLLDFDAQTATRMNRGEKTYAVQTFSDMAKGASAISDVQVDFKETGQKKVINGFNATQSIVNVSASAAAGQPQVNVQMEMEIWVSPDVPGAGELRAFYQRNAEKFPWSAMSQGGNQSTGRAFANIQRKMATLNGVPVLQIMHIKPGGSAEQAARMRQGMAQARARLEDMAKQPGQQGDAARQALARMGGLSSGGTMDMTIESENFSTASIPDSAFAVPSDYKQNPNMH